MRGAVAAGTAIGWVQAEAVGVSLVEVPQWAARAALEQGMILEQMRKRGWRWGMIQASATRQLTGSLEHHLVRVGTLSTGWHRRERMLRTAVVKAPQDRNALLVESTRLGGVPGVGGDHSRMELVGDGLSETVHDLFLSLASSLRAAAPCPPFSSAGNDNQGTSPGVRPFSRLRVVRTEHARLRSRFSTCLRLASRPPPGLCEDDLEWLAATHATCQSDRESRH